jgi:hypothetical protein
MQRFLGLMRLTPTGVPPKPGWLLKLNANAGEPIRHSA